MLTAKQKRGPATTAPGCSRDTARSARGRTHCPGGSEPPGMPGEATLAASDLQMSRIHHSGSLRWLGHGGTGALLTAGHGSAEPRPWVCTAGSYHRPPSCSTRPICGERQGTPDRWVRSERDEVLQTQPKPKPCCWPPPETAAHCEVGRCPCPWRLPGLS